MLPWIEIVPENDDDPFAIGEVLGEPQRIGDSAFAFLIRVVDVVQAELRAVSQQAKEVAGGAAAGDDHDIANARRTKGVQRIVDHRPVVDGQQMFVRHLRERAQAAAEPAREDHALHARAAFKGRHHASLRAVPVDRCGDAFGKGNARSPSQAMQPGAIERVAAIVPEPVGDVFDVTLHRTAAAFDEQPRELHVGHRSSPAGVVGAPRFAALQDVENAARVILDVEPVANL